MDNVTVMAAAKLTTTNTILATQLIPSSQHIMNFFFLSKQSRNALMEAAEKSVRKASNHGTMHEPH